MRAARSGISCKMGGFAAKKECLSVALIPYAPFFLESLRDDLAKSRGHARDVCSFHIVRLSVAGSAHDKGRNAEARDCGPRWTDDLSLPVVLPLDYLKIVPAGDEDAEGIEATPTIS